MDWKQRISQVLSRDDYECQICGSDSADLIVHHKYFKKDKEPWVDYSDEELITLCTECCAFEEKCRAARENGIKELLNSGFTEAEILHKIDWLKNTDAAKQINSSNDILI
jgi:hypothetical protein